MLTQNSLIAELETALQSGSLDKRIASMRRVTDLFLNSAPHLNGEQVDLFDNVMVHLAERIESKALAELSHRLAPVHNAPIGIIRHLARHDDIVVAEPVLSKSERLTASDLIEIAKQKSHGHLMAISSRPLLVEAVTDTLLERGNSEVFCKLAQNSGAAFSKTGFKSLTERAKQDETLAEKVGQRADLPPYLLHDLVAKATHAVRIRLLATVPSEFHAEIKGVLAIISDQVMHDVRTENRDAKSAQEFILDLRQKNKLDESVLCDLAIKHELEKLSAALALMTSTQFELVDHVMHTDNHGGLLVVCKAAGLTWATVDTILSRRFPDHPITFRDLDQAKADYFYLAKPTAIRLLGYWKAQQDVLPS